MESKKYARIPAAALKTPEKVAGPGRAGGCLAAVIDLNYIRLNDLKKYRRGAHLPASGEQHGVVKGKKPPRLPGGSPGGEAKP
jgi:hypothetical protein